MNPAAVTTAFADSGSMNSGVAASQEYALFGMLRHIGTAFVPPSL